MKNAGVTGEFVVVSNTKSLTPEGVSYIEAKRGGQEEIIKGKGGRSSQSRGVLRYQVKT